MKDKIYFPNLNGLRFIAASMVLFPHIEQMRGVILLYADFSIYLHPDLGKLGVILFFTLSGFLITYLLMTEKQQTKDISVKKFFIRRELRIAPLYYLIVILSFFVFPHIHFLDVPNWEAGLINHFGPQLFLYLLFIPNLGISIFAPVLFASQLWTIGVEEQFYFVWAFLAKKIGKFLNILIGVILFYLTVKITLIIVSSYIFTNKGTVNILLTFWNYFTIDAMAIGGLAAYTLFNKKEWLNVLFTKPAQFFIYSSTFILLGTGFRIPYFTYEIFSIFFAGIIINLAGNKKSVINLEFQPLIYLGKISYGIYMYQIICAVIAVKLALYVLPSNWFIYPVAFVLTIIISIISYELFEKRFIKAKTKFSAVVSGDNVVKNS